MAYTDEQLTRIFVRTDGHCHLCGKKLCFSNYAQFGHRGAWEVEHSKPRCNGGSEHGNNLYAACIGCNREKGSVTTRTARGWNARTKAPLSRERKEEIQNNNRLGWSSIGALTGAAIGGPAGFLVGVIVGAIIGDRIKPE
jgi:5-methylcytosine-specific restriction endonuclease McrA